MKKKILYVMMAFLAVTFMNVSLSSCSDDDDKKLEDNVKPEEDFEDLIKPDPNDPALTGDHDPKLIGTWIHDKDEYGWHKDEYYQNGRYKCQSDNGDGDYTWHTGYWSSEDGWLYIYCTNTNYEPYLEDWGIGYEIDDDDNLIIGQTTYKRQ